MRQVKDHGSRETRLETEFSASVGTPPPFKDQGADASRMAVVMGLSVIGSELTGDNYY